MFLSFNSDVGIDVGKEEVWGFSFKNSDDLFLVSWSAAVFSVPGIWQADILISKWAEKNQRQRLVATWYRMLLRMHYYSYYRSWQLNSSLLQLNSSLWQLNLSRWQLNSSLWPMNSSLCYWIRFGMKIRHNWIARITSSFHKVNHFHHGDRVILETLKEKALFVKLISLFTSGYAHH